MFHQIGLDQIHAEQRERERRAARNRLARDVRRLRSTSPASRALGPARRVIDS